MTDGEDINETELVQACEDLGFSNAHRGLGTTGLIDILMGNCAPPRTPPPCMLEQHRETMQRLAVQFHRHIQQQLGCSAKCSACPDIVVAECATFNAKLSRGGRENG